MWLGKRVVVHVILHRARAPDLMAIVRQTDRMVLMGVQYVTEIEFKGNFQSILLDHTFIWRRWFEICTQSDDNNNASQNETHTNNSTNKNNTNNNKSSCARANLLQQKYVNGRANDVANNVRAASNCDERRNPT